jgi:hypothetical protein
MACGKQCCSHWEGGTCSLIRDYDENLLEEVINSDVNILAKFLFKHDCKGDLKSMFNEMTNQDEDSSLLSHVFNGYLK